MAYKKPTKRTDAEWRVFKDYIAHPVEAVKELFKVTPDDWQGDALTALFTQTDRFAIKAAHGPGKTALFAWAGWLFLNGYENCRNVVTAPTFAQVHDVLFPEYAKWHTKMPDRIKEEWIISGGHIRHKGAPYDWFAVGRTSNQPQNLQGFHNANVMIQGDEASGIPQNVFEVIEGVMSEAGEDGRIAKLLMAGNPNFNSGELHDAFTRNRDLYERITITGDPEWDFGANGAYHDDHGRIYYSKRVKKRYVDTISKKYGRDSAVFDVRVRGIFPRAADDAIIPLEWAQRAAQLETPTRFDKQADGFSVICDPSRGGAAETAVGVTRKGVLIELDGKKGTTSSPQVANFVNEKVIKYRALGLRLDEIIVDLPGIGGGIIDLLRRDFDLPVRAYDGGKPLVKGVDPEDDCRMFANVRARDWWKLRRRLEVGNFPIPNDETLIAQLASVKYRYNAQERIIVESKEDMKNRLGAEASPDRGDVLVMSQAPHNEGPSSLVDEDIILGDDRPTAQYAEEMREGLV